MLYSYQVRTKAPNVRNQRAPEYGHRRTLVPIYFRHRLDTDKLKTLLTSSQQARSGSAKLIASREPTVEKAHDVNRSRLLYRLDKLHRVRLQLGADTQ